MDANGDTLAVGLVAGDALDVHDVLQAVDADDFALAALVGAPDDGDFVVFADGYRADLDVSNRIRYILFFHSFPISRT